MPWPSVGQNPPGGFPDIVLSISAAYSWMDSRKHIIPQAPLRGRGIQIMHWIDGNSFLHYGASKSLMRQYYHQQSFHHLLWHFQYTNVSEHQYSSRNKFLYAMQSYHFCAYRTFLKKKTSLLRNKLSVETLTKGRGSIMEVRILYGEPQELEDALVLGAARDVLRDLVPVVLEHLQCLQKEQSLLVRPLLHVGWRRPLGLEGKSTQCCDYQILSSGSLIVQVARKLL